jgi:hypothetical protein
VFQGNRERAVLRHRPAFHRAVGGTAGNQERNPTWQREPRHVAVRPCQISGWEVGDAGLAQLAPQAIDVMQVVAVAVTIRKRAARRDARPFGAGGDGKETEVPGRAVGCLQVVNTTVMPTGQHLTEAQDGRDVPRRGAFVDQDGVEIGRSCHPIAVGRPGEQGDPGVRMVATNGGKGPERKHHIAERAELNDED